MDLLKKSLPGLLTALIITIAGLSAVGFSAKYARAEKVSELEKRVIVLEESQKHISTDLQEIKQTTKDIAKFLLDKSF